MIAHVVLFTPRAALLPAERQALVDAFTAALNQIPTIRRARVGRRHVHGRPGYEQMMTTNYEYAAILEFVDAGALQAYLQHPAHDALAHRFFAAFERALMYDYDLAEGAEGLVTLL